MEIGSENLQYSPYDSDRFNLDVYRGTFSNPDERRVFSAIVDKKVDVAILRAPTSTSHRLQRLHRFGPQSIHADTLVYYSIDLKRYEPLALRNKDLSFSEGTSADESELDQLVGLIFEGYRSHYHANPLFNPKDVLAGYKQWALRYLQGDASNKLWIARRENRIIAFACCRSDKAAESCEGVLYGVHPIYAGGGIYGDLIRYTQSSFKSAGFNSMMVSTQIGNFAVQKVWGREGFYLNAAYDTYHFNTLLGPKAKFTMSSILRFTSAQVEAFGRLSGDMNPIHFDDGAARRAGFDSRICHGLLPASELSRIFGTLVPGPSTLFLGLHMTFLRPLYHNVEYSFHIRFVSDPSAGGHLLAMALVQDSADQICILMYSDLMRRIDT